MVPSEAVTFIPFAFQRSGINNCVTRKADVAISPVNTYKLM